VWFITLIYGLFYLLFGKLAGGQGTFKQVMGVTYWAALIPYILGYLVKLPIVFAKDSVREVSLGLAALAPNADVLSTKFLALTFFGDLFVWWGLIVTIIGFEKVHGMARGQAAVVTILPWALVTGAMFGLNLLFM
ncbi:MAG: YIP1 family protein, partial [bacterium]